MASFHIRLFVICYVCASEFRVCAAEAAEDLAFEGVHAFYGIICV